jgi:DNA-binding transcriptional ArsR family regulator
VRMDERHVRQVTDSRVLAAMSHPLRRRLLDVLAVYGPQPVGTLAERTGQAPANISHHMKVLRESGLVEEAPDRARDRRERWWRPVSAGLRWASSDFGEDPGAEAVLRAAESLNLDRQVALVREWYAAGDDEQAIWGNAAFAADRWLHLTPAELAELNRDLVAVFDRWSAREAPTAGLPTAEDEPRRPVFVFAHGVPATP